MFSFSSLKSYSRPSDILLFVISFYELCYLLLRQLMEVLRHNFSQEALSSSHITLVWSCLFPPNLPERSEALFNFSTEPLKESKNKSESPAGGTSLCIYFLRQSSGDAVTQPVNYVPVYEWKIYNPRWIDDAFSQCGHSNLEVGFRDLVTEPARNTSLLVSSECLCESRCTRQDDITPLMLSFSCVLSLCSRWRWYQNLILMMRGQK